MGRLTPSGVQSGFRILTESPKPMPLSVEQEGTDFLTTYLRTAERVTGLAGVWFAAPCDFLLSSQEADESCMA